MPRGTSSDEMETLWIVFEDGGYDEYFFVAAFRSKEEAEAHVAGMKPGYDRTIVEYKIGTTLEHL